MIPAEEDGDVTAERNRLANDPNAVNDLVRVVGLRKEYLFYILFIICYVYVFGRKDGDKEKRKEKRGGWRRRGEENRKLLIQARYPAPKGGIKVAVKNMTLGIPRSECFGLLGMNGAGKVITSLSLSLLSPPLSLLTL